jgi:hypothetical protein
VAFPEQSCHFFAVLTLANAVVVLNPEARCFGNDLMVRRKSQCGAYLTGLVSSTNKDASMHDVDDAEKRCIHRDQSAGSIRKSLELFQGDIEHRPTSIKQMAGFAKRLFMESKRGNWQSKCSWTYRRFYDLSCMQKRKRDGLLCIDPWVRMSGTAVQPRIGNGPV